MNISILGASGYSGAELIKILLKHRHVTLKKVFAHTSAGKRVDEMFGIFRGQTDLVFERYSAGLVSDSDLVFVALPSGEAMHVVPELLKAKKKLSTSGAITDSRMSQPIKNTINASMFRLKVCAHRHTACRNGTMSR